ncbi:hypothetical protein CGC48_00730 [Capnocytophaga cynodegmi]|uniref:Collagen triple helix repeat protein n=1 Tax=Capnocytophaga cynodegmi TaxID=28189 RepID=A0A286NTD8_9FLAO|nr:hypothetical protein [Capnocytophaga cynodegmi]ATA67269.1 hypothetical protein CGC48_00730 [Capnocytophaga cynodegmi]
MAIGSANKITIELDPSKVFPLENFIEKNPEAADKVLLANGETISKSELKGERGEQGLQGVQGQPGEQGAVGKSAYQVWLDTGNQGSEQDFLKSLQGEGLSEEEKQALDEAKSLKTEIDKQKEKLNNISFSDIKNIPPNLAHSEIKDTIQTIDNQIFELGNVNTSNASELENDSTGLEGFKFWRTKFAELIEFSDKFQYEINFNTEHTLFFKILWYDDDKQYISSSQYKGITYCVTKPPISTRYARFVICFDDFIAGDISMLHLSIKKLALPVLFNKIGESIGETPQNAERLTNLFTNANLFGNTTYNAYRTNIELNVDNIHFGEETFVYKTFQDGGAIIFTKTNSKSIKLFNGFNPNQEVTGITGVVGSYAKIIGGEQDVKIYIYNY